ncbi:MAG: hypothetical protein NTW71_12980 [Deltaproteobacteria bacterium]|nr:hypothetical protein [Deltaproteobacteria bacterium]
MDKITKEMSEGKCVYRNERGEIINTYTETVEDVMNSKMAPLRDFLEMQRNREDDDDVVKVAYIALALLERAEEKTDEAADYIDKNYGRVEIERAMYEQYVLPETMLGVVFRPRQEEVLRAATA